MRTALRASATPKLSVKARLYTRLKMVDVLSLPERDIARMAQTLESDDLFKKLMGLADGGLKIIRRQPYQGARLSSRFYELNENLAGDTASLDVQALLGERREIAGVIHSIGQENFERYFLRQEESLSRREISDRCGLTEERAQAVFDFLLKFSCHEEFHRPVGSAPASSQPYCLGRIEKDEGGFVVAFFSPHLARGRYRIDYDAWEKARANGVLSSTERSRAAALLHQAETLNMRADNFHRILREVLETERAFLSGGLGEQRRTLSLRETARRLNVSSSTVCRAVSDRSVITPWGEEVLLARLFPQKKEVLREVLEANAVRWAGAKDGDVQNFLKTEYQLRVPRRTVNYWRRRVEKAHE